MKELFDDIISPRRKALLSPSDTLPAELSPSFPRVETRPWLQPGQMLLDTGREYVLGEWRDGGWQFFAIRKDKLKWPD